ncbi:unnamed protein product, partial [marine sediment metagenome]
NKVIYLLWLAIACLSYTHLHLLPPEPFFPFESTSLSYLYLDKEEFLFPEQQTPVPGKLQ